MGTGNGLRALIAPRTAIKKPNGDGSPEPNGPGKISESFRRCRPGTLTRPRRFTERWIVADGERKAVSRSGFLPERDSGRAPEH